MVYGWPWNMHLPLAGDGGGLLRVDCSCYVRLACREGAWLWCGACCIRGCRSDGHEKGRKCWGKEGGEETVVWGNREK